MVSIWGSKRKWWFYSETANSCISKSTTTNGADGDYLGTGFHSSGSTPDCRHNCARCKQVYDHHCLHLYVQMNLAECSWWNWFSLKSSFACYDCKIEPALASPVMQASSISPAQAWCFATAAQTLQAALSMSQKNYQCRQKLRILQRNADCVAPKQH